MTREEIMLEKRGGPEVKCVSRTINEDRSQKYCCVLFPYAVYTSIDFDDGVRTWTYGSKECWEKWLFYSISL